MPGKLYEFALAIGGKLNSSFGSAINKTNSGLKSVDANVSKIAKSGETNMHKLSKSIATVGAVTAGFVTGTLMKVGSDFQGYYKTISTGTGAAGAELDALKGNFKNVLSSVGNDGADVAKVVTDLNKRTDATGEALEGLSKTILRLGNVSGAEFEALSSSGTRMMNSWGISAENGSETLDKLWVAAQKTGVDVSVLFETMANSGAALRTLGIDFDTSAAMIANFEKSGVNGSQALTALNIAAKTMAKNGVKDMNAGLKDTFDKIKNANDATSASKIALDMFGKSGIQMADAIRTGKMSVDDLVASMKDSKDAISNSAWAASTWQGKMKLLQNKAAVAMEPVASKMMDTFKVALEKIVPFAERIMPKVSGAFSAVGNAIERIKPSFENIRKIGENFGVILGKIFVGGKEEGATFQDTLNGIADKIAGVMDKAAELSSFIANNWSAIQPIVLGIVGAMVAWKAITMGMAIYTKVTQGMALATKLLHLEKLKDLAVSIQLQAMYVKDAIVKGASTAATWAQNAATSALSVVQGILNAVMAVNPMVWIIIAVVALVAAFVLLWNKCEGFRNFFIGMWEKIKVGLKAFGAFFIAIWEKIKAPVMAVFSFIVNIVKTYISIVVAVFKFYFNIIKTVIKVIVEVFKKIFSVIVTIVKTYISIWVAIFKACFNAIKAVITTVINVFKAVFEFVVNVIKTYIAIWIAIFSAAWEGIKAIFSAVGGFFQGVWAGIVAIFSGIGAWFGEKFQMAVDAVMGAWSGIKDFFSELWGGIWDTIRGFINKIIGGINNIIGGFNSIQIDVPEGVPVMGGTKLGFNIPTIPMLAKGGIVDRATLLMAGEGNEPEAITPLSKLKQFIGEGSGGFGGSEKFVFSPIMNFYGAVSRKDAEQAAKVTEQELEKAWDRFMAKKKRLAFSTK